MLHRELKTKGQLINTRMRKNKTKVIHFYKEKQVRFTKDTLDISFLLKVLFPYL